RVRGFAAEESRRRGPAKGDLSDRDGSNRGGVGLVVELAIPGNQEDLDIVVRARGGRVQRDPTGSVVSDCGRMAEADLVPAVCVDRNELHHDLSSEQYHRGL